MILNDAARRRSVCMCVHVAVPQALISGAMLGISPYVRHAVRAMYNQNIAQCMYSC